jgi:Astacin (Peptidase family M12A)
VKLPKTNLIRHGLILFIAANLSHYPNIAKADDLLGIMEKQRSRSNEEARKIAEIDRYRDLLARRARSDSQNKGLEGVVEKLLVWRNGAISVCFLDGRLEREKQIAEIASEWTVGTSVHFDFGDTDHPRQCDADEPSEIRVTFEGRGSWSEVGTKARFRAPDRPTIQLGAMDGAEQLNQDQVGTVLHEFGHALGFEHEHKNPNASCEKEYNWEYLYASLPYPKAQVDLNMKRLLVDETIAGLYTTI